MSDSNRLRRTSQYKAATSRCTRVMRTSPALVILTSLMFSTPVLSTQPQNSAAVEYQLKAAFLFNFAKFIEWPVDAFRSNSAPINLCVYKHDPFAGALDEVIRGKTINNRELQARRIAEPGELGACQLVFIDETEEKELPNVLKTLKGTSTLVVGEAEDFAEHGGAVQFFLENNKLRFAINVDAIQRARLQASSKLLTLAKIVHDGGHVKGS